MIGFAGRIGERLNTATEQAVTDSAPGAALVLRDRRSAAEQARDRAYPDVPDTMISGSSGAGYQAGRAAGSRADLGQTRVGNIRGCLDQ